MNIGARTAVWSADAKLPYKRRLAYLKSDQRNQWINTGVVANNETGLLINMTFDGTSNDDVVAVGRTQGGLSRFWINIFDKNILYGFRNYYRHVGVVLRDDVFYSIGNNHLNKRIAELDGKEIYTTIYRDQLSYSSNPIALFCGYGIEGAHLFCKMKCSLLEITQGSEVAHRYIPVMSWDDTPEMYDEVTGTFAERHGDFMYGELT